LCSQLEKGEDADEQKKLYTLEMPLLLEKIILMHVTTAKKKKKKKRDRSEDGKYS
jgi:hypothetical protein